MRTTRLSRALQAALHNLATHDGSPPSSTSRCSVASSTPDARTLSAQVTSITANECFDGSALFDSTASPSCNAPADSFLHTANGGHQTPPSAEADVRHARHQNRPNTANGASSNGCTNQPAPHQLHVSDQHELQEQQQHQPACEAPGQMSGQTSGHISSQILTRLPGQIPCQMAGQMPTQVTGQMHQRQQSPGSPGQLPTQSTGQSVGMQANYFSSASWAKPRSRPQAATTLLQMSESSEELMTLEELEHHIASLNKTLLREPSGRQTASVPSDQADIKKKQSLFDAQNQSTGCRLQRQRQAGVQSSRGDQSSKFGRDANRSSDSTDGLAEEEPDMTAWQKLTAKHQMPQGSSATRFSAVDGEGDVYSSASSPAEPTVSPQGMPCKLRQHGNQGRCHWHCMQKLALRLTSKQSTSVAAVSTYDMMVCMYAVCACTAMWFLSPAYSTVHSSRMHPPWVSIKASQLKQVS